MPGDIVENNIDFRTSVGSVENSPTDVDDKKPVELLLKKTEDITPVVLIGDLGVIDDASAIGIVVDVAGVEVVRALFDVVVAENKP